MTEVTERTVDTAVVSRDLTPVEVSDLDALRFALARTVDRTEPRAITWLWDKVVTESAGGAAPAGFVEAVAAALGDLLAVNVPTARWSVWPGPEGPTLGVVSDKRPMAPVVPFLDAHDKWESGQRGWVVDYLARAAAHLAAAGVPAPRQSPEGTSGAPVPDAARGPVAGPADAAAEIPVAEATVAGAPVAEDTTTADDPAVAETVPEPAAEAVPEPAVETVQELAVETVQELAVETVQEPAPVSAPADLAALTATPEAWSPDESLEEFALATLDHAVAVLRQAGAFDHDTFVVVVDGTGRHTETCPGEPTRALPAARALVATSGAPRGAAAWIDREPRGLPGPQQHFPAVVVEAWQRGEAVRVARRFVDDVLGTDTIGAPLLVPGAEPLL